MSREFDVEDIEKNARTIRDILMHEFNWSHLAFLDGMATVDYSSALGKQVWKPRSRLTQKLFGGSYGRIVALEEILVPDCFVKFCIPNETIQASADFQNWRGYFDRETSYTATYAGYILDRWVRFLGFQTLGFDFDVEYLNQPAVARTPTIVFFGADWIRVSPPRFK